MPMADRDDPGWRGAFRGGRSGRRGHRGGRVVPGPRARHLGIVRWISNRLGPVVVLLAIVATAQAIALGADKIARQSLSGQTITVGDDLSSIAINHEGNTVSTLGTRGGTLLLVFDPNCAHSRRIASEWSSWLIANQSENLALLAVSPGSLSETISYARMMNWSVEVGSVDPDHLGENQYRVLTRRTPWVFAVDGGHVVAEGHGARIHEVAQALHADRLER